MLRILILPLYTLLLANYCWAAPSLVTNTEYFPSSNTPSNYRHVVEQNIAYLHAEMGAPNVGNIRLAFTFYDKKPRPHVVTNHGWRHLHLSNKNLSGASQQHLIHELFHALYQPLSMGNLGSLERERWATYLQLRSSYKGLSNEQIKMQLPTIPAAIINTVSSAKLRTAGARTSRAYYIASCLPLFGDSHANNLRRYQQIVYESSQPNLLATLQEKLQEAGHYKGPISNELDISTRKALAKFQRANRIEVSIKLSQATRKALGYNW